MTRHKDSLLGARQVACTTVSHCVSLMANVQIRGLSSRRIPSRSSPDAALVCAGESKPRESRMLNRAISPRVALERIDRTHENCRNAMLRDNRAVGDAISQAFVFSERIKAPFARQGQCISKFDE